MIVPRVLLLLVSVSIQSSSEERLRWCEEGRLQLSDRWPEQVVGIIGDYRMTAI